MNAAWSAIPAEQRQLFLTQTGLSALPEPSQLTEAQWNKLVTIIGEEKAEQFRLAAEKESVYLPVLELPKDIGDWSSIMAMVAEIRAKMGQTQEKLSVEDVEIQKDLVSAANKKEAEQLKEILGKLEKSAKSGIWSKIFKWIGSVAAAVGATALAIVSGGAAIPAAAVALLSLTMVILEETGAMEKIVDFLAEHPAVLWATLTILGGSLGFLAGGALFGVMKGGALDEDGAKNAVQIALAAGMLVASLATVMVGGGGNVANLASKLAVYGSRILGGVSQAAGGVTGFFQTYYNYEASKVKADVEENKAWLAKLQHMLSEEMDRLQQIIEQLNAGVSDASDLLGDIANSNRSIIANMGI